MNKPTELRFCIQCRDLVSDVVGSFIYHRDQPFRAVSPVFEHCGYLFEYMVKQGLKTGVLSDFNVYESADDDLTQCCGAPIDRDTSRCSKCRD